MDSVFKNQCSNSIIFIFEILLRDEFFSVNKLIINELNDLLKAKCSFKKFDFLNQSNGSALHNGAFAFSLLYSSGLYSAEKDNSNLTNQF